MPVTKGKTLVEHTTEQIIDYITRNKMQPGQQLPTEAEFTSELNVSRGTLRDAFKVLIARNILEARQGSGTFIADNMGIPEDPLGLTFIYDDETLAIDMLDVRLMLEPTIAGLAAINATPEQRAQLQALTNTLEKHIGEGKAYADDDGKFHTLIATASGNRVISNLTYILFNSIYKNIALTMDVQKENNTLFYHKKILGAILEGNANQATMYMNMHLYLLKDFMLNRYKEKMSAMSEADKRLKDLQKRK